MRVQRQLSRARASSVDAETSRYLSAFAVVWHGILATKAYRWSDLGSPEVWETGFISFVFLDKGVSFVTNCSAQHSACVLPKSLHYGRPWGGRGGRTEECA